jgi:predicted Zn-dependent peptidase
MAGLAFSEKSLDVQRNVVSEEFKQNYLNQPYGDVYILLRPLAYKVHPYQWDTIGKDISHIQEASMTDVKIFFKKFYCPNNAIMVVAGDVETKEIERLSEKWFGSIPKGPDNERNLPVEPVQTEIRKLTVERNVPFDAIYKVYHCCAKADKEFHSVDLLSDVLSNGKSSRLFHELLMKKQLFSDINAYISGDRDKGLFFISGKLTKGVKMEDAENAIHEELIKVQQQINESELEKVKNKIESTLVFSEMSVLSKAMNLAFAELIGDAALMNKEIEKYRSVTSGMIKQQAKEIFRETNSSTLYYKSEK